MALLDSITKVVTKARSRSSGVSVVGSMWTKDNAGGDYRPGDGAILPPRFRVRSKLGEGGMGAVYRAYDTELGQEVAVKVLIRPAPEDVFALKSEFRALAELRHPNLVDLYELLVDDARCCFTMEVVPGNDLVGHVRGSLPNGECPDLALVRDTATQLARALSTVHDAGKLHRDVKPHNVRVTPSGRVVLLDFGLVAPLAANSAHTQGAGGPLGTFGYMAPEQARGEPLGPAADWFSYGAALFEVVTGRLPSEKPSAWVFGSSAAAAIPRARSLSPRIPKDLDDLISELLDPVAERRPLGAEVLKRLSGAPAQPGATTTPVSVLPARLPFENREAELRALDDAFARSRSGSPTVVHVHGPSGMGKTELLRRFTESKELDGALVLRGRCHPQEAIAFNALDGVIDELSRWLDGLPSAEVSALLPREAGMLALLFPVLGRVQDVADGRIGAPDMPVLETRRLAVAALKELLASIADRRPLVVWLDDVHWGDDDSGRILQQLLEPPDNPSALVLLSYRTEDRERSATLQALGARHDERAPAFVDVRLEPLTNAATERLFDRLLGASWSGPRETFARLAEESDGLPFFALELARSLGGRARSTAAPAQLKLADLLVSRVNALPAEAQNLLEVVAVAGGPLERDLLLSAAGNATTGRRLIAELERDSFVRTTTIDARRETEIYHHRLRDAVLGTLHPKTRKRHHRAIADAMLTSTNPVLALVVDHYEAAGDDDAVRRYVVPAAKQAAQVMASDRAAKLYRRAIEIDAADLSPSELHARLAAALVEAGRGYAAAQAFERAADLAERSSSELDRVVFLRRRSAEQYLQSGKWADATRALDLVLSPLGLELPKNRGDALVRILAARARTSTKPLTLPPDTKPLPTDVTDRVYLLYTLTQVYSFADFMLGMVFSSQLLADAVRTPSAEVLMMGLALETSVWASTPGRFARRQCDRMLSAYEALVPQGSALERGGLHATRGVVSWYRGEFARAIQSLDQAPAEYRIARYDTSFNIAMAHCFRFPTLAHLGRLREISATLEPLLADAEARGNDFFVSIVPLGHQCLAWLAANRPERVEYWRNRVEQLLPPGFTVLHQMCVLADVLTALYRREPSHAKERLERAWPLLRKGLFLSMPYFREDLLQLRARVLLALAEADPSKRGVLLREVRGLARKVEKEPAPYSAAHAELLRAGVAALSGRRKDAIAALEGALDGFEATGLALYAASCRLALGDLGGGSGKADSHRAGGEAWMENERVRCPRRLASMMAPGCIDAKRLEELTISGQW